jgi:hypothetical protein
MQKGYPIFLHLCTRRICLFHAAAVYRCFITISDKELWAGCFLPTRKFSSPYGHGFCKWELLPVTCGQILVIISCSSGCYLAGPSILFLVSDTQSSDTSMLVSDTNTLILFKIRESDTQYSNTPILYKNTKNVVFMRKKSKLRTRNKKNYYFSSVSSACQVLCTGILRPP